MTERPTKKYFTTAVIKEQEEIASGIFRMRLMQEEIARDARPGQFVSLYCRDRSRLLPRPISICEADAGEGIVTLVYRTAGNGTKELSALKAGEKLDIAGPLGNGYPLDAADGRTAMLIGGGIGIPPIVELAKRLAGRKIIVAGYRNEGFLMQELAGHGALYCASEDGSIGTKGTVLDCIREQDLKADVIFACGPAPMLRALKEYAAQQNMECWISLEERMACGIGACLACVCRTAEVDEHSQVKNRRICAEGPVFRAEEVEI